MRLSDKPRGEDSQLNKKVKASKVRAITNINNFLAKSEFQVILELYC